jgi:ketosteroid isomerase-like protein
VSTAALETDAAAFVVRFADFWRAPAPERLDALLAEDVLLVAPLTPTTRTLADGKRAFAGLLALAPDLTGEVHRWGATADGVLIEFTLSGTAAGTAISWDAVDRISLGDDGLASARVSYFDSGPLVRALARHPRSWLPFLRSRLSA